MATELEAFVWIPPGGGAKVPVPLGGALIAELRSRHINCLEDIVSMRDELGARSVPTFYEMQRQARAFLAERAEREPEGDELSMKVLELSLRVATLEEKIEELSKPKGKKR